jgi:hypothetical protein
MAKVKADEAKVKAESKPDPFGNALLDKLRTEAKAGAESGKEPAKPGRDLDVAPPEAAAKPPSKYQPPSRMADDAKQAWGAAPEPVQREVERMHRELSQGIEKYRAGAERDHSLQQYHELARQGGKDLKSVVDGYWQAEQAIRRDPVAGLDAVCKNLGLSLRDVAAHVMGQPPDQQQSAQSAELHQLRQTVQQLQQHLGGVTQTIQQQRMAVVVDKINTFKSANPRYDELEADMVKLIEGGLARDLPDAYAKADRLNPAPARLQAHAEPAQTRESKSISGAPSAGSSPAARKPSKSIRDALQSASARAG